MLYYDLKTFLCSFKFILKGKPKRGCPEWHTIPNEIINNYPNKSVPKFQSRKESGQEIRNKTKHKQNWIPTRGAK